MKKVLKILDKSLAKVSIGLIKLYQRTFSPDKGIFSSVLKGKICSHEPHCSEYAMRTLKRYGFRHGIGKATDRILHCTPKMNKLYDPEHYRIVFCSSAPIGISFLEELSKDKRFEIVGVVTQADKPVGRGLHLQENIIKIRAKELFFNNPSALSGTSSRSSDGTQPDREENCIQWTDSETQFTPLSGGEGGGRTERSGSEDDGRGGCVQNEERVVSAFIATPTRINPDKSLEGKTFYDWLKEKNPDFLVVIAYGKIIPQSILDIPHFGAINVHGSLLPKYRGASPLQSIFLDKAEKSWVTIMKMDAGMDTGDIIDTIGFPLKFERTVANLIEAIQKVGPKFLTTTLWNFAKGLLTPAKQEESEATSTKKIEKADGFFVLSQDSLEDIYAKYRAFSLWPKVRFIRQDKKIIIEKLVLDEEPFEVHKYAPLLENGKLNLAVKEILLKPEGKKEMDWKSFVNGYLK